MIPVLCRRHQLPSFFLSAKSLQHYKCSGLNQAYFARPLMINTFFVSSPGVNFIRENREYAEVLHHNFTQCVCTGHTGVGHSLFLLYIMNSSYPATYIAIATKLPTSYTANYTHAI